jgi:hypothetical protein
MPWLLAWWLVIGLGFIGFGLIGGSSLAVQRRPHFWIRVLLEALGMVAAVLVLFGAIELKLLPEHVLVLLWLVLVVGAVIAAPACCYRSGHSPPGSSDGGGGGGIDPVPPSGPQGGIPLPDAKQSDARVRDHTRPKLHTCRPRRSAREPARGPTRVRLSRGP